MARISGIDFPNQSSMVVNAWESVRPKMSRCELVIIVSMEPRPQYLKETFTTLYATITGFTAPDFSHPFASGPLPVVLDLNSVASYLAL